MTNSFNDKSEKKRSVEIVVQFSKLIHAWQEGDYRDATEAENKLAELQVFVRLPKRRKAKGEQQGSSLKSEDWG